MLLSSNGQDPQAEIEFDCSKLDYYFEKNPQKIAHSPRLSFAGTVELPGPHCIHCV